MIYPPYRYHAPRSLDQGRWTIEEAYQEDEPIATSVRNLVYTTWATTKRREYAFAGLAEALSRFKPRNKTRRED